MIVQPDGTLAVACRSDAGGGGPFTLILIRTDADGNLDPTFGVGGIVRMGFPDPRGLIRQSDGKLVVTGTGFANNQRTFFLARFNTDGTLDTGFGGTGVVIGPGGVYADALALTQQLDGKLVAAGEAPSVERFGLVRFNLDGTLDTTFGTGGVASPAAVDGFPGDAARALAVQADGRLLAAGGWSFVVARYLPGTCGNGILDPGEECDDGNTVSGDGCDATCSVTRCGNAVTTAGEECDDGNSYMNDECKNGCKRNFCGDGVLLVGVEQCDDGNSNDNDGCKNNCTLNICGDGVVRTGVEQCDDGNRNTSDACTNNCTIAVCGDGVLYFRVEQCDDGNRVDGDGCEADCTITGLADAVVLPLAPRTVHLRRAHQQLKTRVRVKVRDGGSTPAGQTIQLTAASDCPAGTIGESNFGTKAAGAPNLVSLSNGGTATAVVPLTISADAFVTFNRDAPRRCTLTMQATPVPPGGTNDPALSNNSAAMELNVIDRTDPAQTAFHQVVMDSMGPVSVKLANGQTRATRTVRARIGNADRGEMAGHTSSIRVSDGDCPAGTVGTPNFELGRGRPRTFTTVKGGSRARAIVPLTINAGAFTSRSAGSPARCSALLTVTGPGGDTDATNDSMKLVVDVTDANDF